MSTSIREVKCAKRTARGSLGMEASTTDPQPGAWQSSNDPSGSLVDDGSIRLRPLVASDVDAHLFGCDRIIINRLGGGEPATATEVRSWLEDNA